MKETKKLNETEKKIKEESEIWYEGVLAQQKGVEINPYDEVTQGLFHILWQQGYNFERSGGNGL